MTKLFLILLFSYNPFFIYFLLKNGGADALTLRIGLSIIIIIILSYVFLSKIALNSRIFLRIPNLSFTFIIMNIIFLFYLISISVGVIKNNNLPFIILDIFFYGELFLGYYLTKLSYIENDKIEKFVPKFGIFLFLMCISSLAIYYYLTFIENIQFGALRVYVSGITLNRLADFIIPIFAAPIIFYFAISKRKIFHFIFIFLTISLCLLTFYRTVYLAVIVGCLVFLIQNFTIKQFVYFLIILLLTILFLYNYDSQLINTILDRFSTIFAAETSVSQSRTIRLQQLSYLSNMFNYFPLGYGVGGQISDYVISAGGQIIAYFLIFGPISGILLFFIFIKSIVDSFLVSRNMYSKKLTFILVSCSAIIASCVVIVALFPYKYFPIHLLMGIAIGLIEYISLNNNKSEKQN